MNNSEHKSLILKLVERIKTELPDVEALMEKAAASPALHAYGKKLYAEAGIPYVRRVCINFHPVGTKLYQYIWVLAGLRKPDATDLPSRVLAEDGMLRVLHDISAAYNYKKNRKCARYFVSYGRSYLVDGTTSLRYRSKVFGACFLLSRILFKDVPGDSEIYIKYLKDWYRVEDSPYYKFAFATYMKRVWGQMFVYDSIETLSRRGVIIHPSTMLPLSRQEDKDIFIEYMLRLPEVLADKMVCDGDSYTTDRTLRMTLAKKHGKLSVRLREHMCCYKCFFLYQAGRYGEIVDTCLERKAEVVLRNPSRSLKGYNAHLRLPENHKVYTVTDGLATIGRLVRVISALGIPITRVAEKKMRISDWVLLRRYMRARIDNAHVSKKIKKQNTEEVIVIEPADTRLIEEP